VTGEGIFFYMAATTVALAPEAFYLPS